MLTNSATIRIYISGKACDILSGCVLSRYTYGVHYSFSNKKFIYSHEGVNIIHKIFIDDIFSV